MVNTQVLSQRKSCGLRNISGFSYAASLTPRANPKLRDLSRIHTDTAMAPVKSESGRIRPDYRPMRPTKQPRLSEAEESKAIEAEGQKVAEAQERKTAEAQGRKMAEVQGPEEADPGEKYWSDSDGSESEKYGTCIICWKDDHTVATCPLTYFVPTGELVSPYAEIVCWCCQEDPEVAHPGEIVARRAMVKPGV